MKLTTKRSADYWMRQALQQAKIALKHNEVPIGAIVVCDEEIVGQAYNRTRNDCDPSAHAEILALRKAALSMKNYRLPNCQIYVTVEPCIMCLGMMIQARIKKLTFGCYEPKSGAVVSTQKQLEFPSHNHKLSYRGLVLANESRQLLRDFFSQRR